MDASVIDEHTVDIRNQLLSSQYKCEELAQMLKSQERDYNRSIIDLKSEIEAHKKKSELLQTALITRAKSSINLETEPDEQMQILSYQNYKYSERIKLLETELEEIKNSKLTAMVNKDNTILELANQVDAMQRSLIDYEMQIQTLSKQMLAASLKAQSEYRDLEDRYKELSDDLYDKENKLDKAMQQIKEANLKAVKDKEKITESLESEIEKLNDTIDKLEATLASKQAEMKTLHHKLKQNYEEISNNQDLISELVEKNRDLELKIEALEKGLSVQGKTIKSLEQEITDYSEDLTEIESERISELEKKVLSTESKLKDAEKRIQSLTIIKETMYEDYKSEVNDLKRQLDLLENEKKSKNDLISKLQDEIKTLNQLIEDQEASFNSAKEAIQDEHSARILELKNTITELEKQIQELMLKGDSKSFYEYSLEDELSTLEDIKNKTHLSRTTTMRENYADSVLAVGDIQTEKEFRSQILEQENAALQKQVENLQLEVFTLYNKPNRTEELESEIDILKSEITRLEVQLVVSTESWADENNRLREEIDEAERIAIEAKMQYAEAATDRDMYLKQYHDLKQSKQRKFTKFFKRNTRS